MVFCHVIWYLVTSYGILSRHMGLILSRHMVFCHVIWYFVTSYGFNPVTSYGILSCYIRRLCKHSRVLGRWPCHGSHWGLALPGSLLHPAGLPNVPWSTLQAPSQPAHGGLLARQLSQQTQYACTIWRDKTHMTWQNPYDVTKYHMTWQNTIWRDKIPYDVT